ncbi:50S ribosomal protein L29, partial [Campylobacter jejuni]|nr:50S ribosomal protein L29 [Campylobacter jejuni]
DKTAAELATIAKRKKGAFIHLKQKLKTMQLTNPKEISQVKKDIARINTAINALR